MTAPEASTASRLSVDEARARILAELRPLPAETVQLTEALGRVLAEAAVSPVALPPWRNSAMDGYACRAADVRAAHEAAPVTLRVLETIAAGAFPTLAIGPGEASRIMTGAPLPDGADSVVRVEDTDGGVELAVVRDGRDAGMNIRPPGEDVAEGETVLRAGTAIGPAQLGVLASVGAARVRVHRRPRVAILGSGDELVDVERFDEVRAGRRLVSSNSYTLVALVRQMGAEPVDLGVARDDPDDLRARLAGAAGCDLLVTSAGVSVGAHDYTRAVLEGLGAEMRFWRVRIRPGAPLGFGVLRGVPWIGLPGNPVSTMVTFELFVRPALRRLQGHRRLQRRALRVVAGEDIALSARLTHFLRATLATGDDGRLVAHLTGPQGSGLLTSMARADVLLVVPEGVQRVAAGDPLDALALGEDALFGGEDAT